jgi:hypothetical protein
MCVSINKRLISIQNGSGLLSRNYHGKCWNTISHFKPLRGQRNTVSRATCCPRATGWWGLVHTFVFKTKTWYIPLCFIWSNHSPCELQPDFRYRHDRTERSRLEISSAANYGLLGIESIPGGKSKSVTLTFVLVTLYLHLRNITSTYNV